MEAAIVFAAVLLTNAVWVAIARKRNRRESREARSLKAFTKRLS
jgi:hypothetical protein